MEKGWYIYCRADEGEGEQVSRCQVMGNGGKGVTAEQEGVAGSGMTGELVCRRESGAVMTGCTGFFFNLFCPDATTRGKIVSFYRLI